MLLHASAIRDSNRDFYRFLSVEQTATATQLGDILAGSPTGQVFLLEPWIDNVAHLQQFAWLYHGIDPSRVARIARPTGVGADATLLKRRDVFDWSEDDGFVRATRFPDVRRRHRGGSRIPAPPGRKAIHVFRIAPATAAR